MTDNRDDGRAVREPDNLPLISVVMPCYNAAERVGVAIDCVLAQSYPNVEVVVTNDGSVDNSLAVISAYAERDARVKVVDQPNKGAGPARNSGLQVAGGEFIAFLDADDSWDPHCLEKLYLGFVDAPDAALVYCGWQNLGKSGGQGEPFVPPDYETDDKVEKLLQGCRWPIHGALVRHAAIKEVGGFDEGLTSCMDYDLWLRVAGFRKIARVPEVLAYYHHYEGDRITSNAAKIALNHWKVQRKFIAAHPEIESALGRDKVRSLTLGELLHRGYVAYWRRDLDAARAIFRVVMQQHYGGVKDYRYMLPALLPKAMHQVLIKVFEKN